jgi:Zn-dependent oligopeptidase
MLSGVAKKIFGPSSSTKGAKPRRTVPPDHLVFGAIPKRSVGVPVAAGPTPGPGHDGKDVWGTHSSDPLAVSDPRQLAMDFNAVLQEAYELARLMEEKPKGESSPSLKEIENARSRVIHERRRAELVTEVHPDPRLRAVADAGRRVLESAVMDLCLLVELQKGEHTFSKTLVIHDLNSKLAKIESEFSDELKSEPTFFLPVAEARGVSPEFRAAHLTGDRKYLAVQRWDLAQFPEGKTRRAVVKLMLQSLRSQREPLLHELLKARAVLERLDGKRSWSRAFFEKWNLGLRWWSRRGIDAARNLFNKIFRMTDSRVIAEERALLAEKRLTFPKAKRVDRGEVGEWRRKLLDRKWPIDQKAMRPYLDFNQMQSRTLKEVGKLFNLEFEALPYMPTWDPSVTVYEVKDPKSSRVLGQIYLDLVARPDKAPRPRMHPLGGTPRRVVLAAAVAQPDADGHLFVDLDTVNPFFHELGHALQELLQKGGRTPESEQHLAEVESEFLELWACQPEVRRALFQTPEGDPIPKELVHASLARLDFQMPGTIRWDAAYSQLTLEMGDGETDLSRLESRYRRRTESLSNLIEQLPDESAEYLTNPDLLQGPRSSIYATARPIAYQLLKRFRKEGLFNPQVGAEFRKQILEKGDISRKDVEQFSGHAFSLDALAHALKSHQLYV